LQVENLESRTLLSGSPLDGLVATPAGHLGSAAYYNPYPSGYTPSQISHAYGFDQITFNDGTIEGDGSGQTIAIVDAYRNPNIASDLHVFDQSFNLPDPVLTQVSQFDGYNYPAVDAGWSLETALDVEWAHAVAPKADILLVQTRSASFSDLLAGVDYARSQPGVSVVSMSWGGGEFYGGRFYDGHFTTPAGHDGGTFLASSGDSGGITEYPAVSPNVLSVGGTTLRLNADGSYNRETAWSGSDGGISYYEPRPGYQSGVQNTRSRTVPDVAYDASMSTGFAV